MWMGDLAALTAQRLFIDHLNGTTEEGWDNDVTDSNQYN